MRRKAHDAQEVGRWKGTGALLWSLQQPGAPGMGKIANTKTEPPLAQCSLLTWLFWCLLGSFSSSPFTHCKAYRCGEGEHKSSLGWGRAHLLQEMKQNFSCGSKKASERAQPAWGDWGHLGHDVSGHCRDSQGTKGGVEHETIRFPLG